MIRHISESAKRFLIGKIKQEDEENMGILDRFLGKKKVKMPSIEIEVSAGQPIVEYPSYSVQKLPNGDYLINPGASFELTLYNANKNKIDLFVDALNQSINQSNYYTIQNSMGLLTIVDIRCREIDAYVDEYRPKYEKLVKELIEKHPDWKDANERDRKDILNEVRQTALDMIYVRPDVDLNLLFEYYPWDDPLPRKVLQKYPLNTISKYIRVWDEKMKVKVIPADNADRDLYEEMVELGLAIRGREISTEKILTTLKMDQLRDIASKFDVKIPRKKEEAAKILSDIEGINEYLDKNVSFRELFQLTPLPEEFKDVEIKKIGEFMDYCRIIADLIGRTYTFAYYDERRAHSDRDSIEGYKVLCADDERTCPYCKEQAKKKYSKKNIPNTPFHLACRCGVIPKLRNLSEE